jgi:hypothetical protein
VRPENLHWHELPIRAPREPQGSDGSGVAAKAFNVMHDHSDYPSYLTGALVLPPGSIKDPESVGRSAQVFTVLSCQPDALEVAFSDPDEAEGSFNPVTATRFFLSPGRMFRIPPGNCYRLENRSTTIEAELTYTIIRMHAPDTVVEEAGMHGEEEDPATNNPSGGTSTSGTSESSADPLPSRYVTHSDGSEGNALDWLFNLCL